MKILVLFAHPALEKSRVNKELIKEYKKFESVTFHDLYETYPDFDINITHEQKLLSANDLIIFHHPFFWYSTPALLKEWQDLVLEHGWAFGQNGDKLKEKYIMNIITTGGKEQSYSSDGYNGVTMGELLLPLQRTFILCKMQFIPPFIVHGTHSITDEEINSHKSDLNNLLDAFSNDTVDLNHAMQLDRINSNIKSVIQFDKLKEPKNA